MIRQFENYSNRSKYSESDVAEIEAQRRQEMDAIGEFDNEMARRRQTIVNGLTSKYGFSVDGAETVASLIEKEWHTDADMTHLEFAIQTGKIKCLSKAKEEAALRAYDYYWR